MDQEPLSVLTVAGPLVWAVSAVVSAVAPGAVFDAAAVEAAPVTLLTAAISYSKHVTPATHQQPLKETQIRSQYMWLCVTASITHLVCKDIESLNAS